MKKFKSYIPENNIEVVRQVTYLDFSFIPSGKKHIGTENLISKGKKRGS